MTSRNYDLLKPPSPEPHCPKQHATAAASLKALGGATRRFKRAAGQLYGLRDVLLADRVLKAQSDACFSDRFAPKGDHGELLPEED